MKQYHYSYIWICPKCFTCGGEGERCPNDRRKLRKITTKWEDDSNESYNQALSIKNLKGANEVSNNKDRR